MQAVGLLWPAAETWKHAPPLSPEMLTDCAGHLAGHTAWLTPMSAFSTGLGLAMQRRKPFETSGQH